MNAATATPAVMPRLKALILRLFQEHRVAVAPGRFFDSPAHFRLSFGGATGNLRRGLAAIAATLETV